jgi:hypothetical protein
MSPPAHACSRLAQRRSRKVAGTPVGAWIDNDQRRRIIDLALVSENRWRLLVGNRCGGRPRRAFRTGRPVVRNCNLTEDDHATALAIARTLKLVNEPANHVRKSSVRRQRQLQLEERLLCSKLCSDRVGKRRIGTRRDRMVIGGFWAGNNEFRRDLRERDRALTGFQDRRLQPLGHLSGGFKVYVT